MKILILRLSSLGDIVLTQPIAAWLRAFYPQAQIDYVVKPQFEELVTLMGCGLNPIIYRKSLSFHLQLKKQRYDLVLDLHGKLSTYLLMFAAQAKQNSRYRKARSTRQKIVKGNRELAISSTVDLYKSALENIHSAVEIAKPRLYLCGHIDSPPLPEAEERIVIFPGATHNTKRYPANYYKELIRKSPKAHQYIILGSPSEQDLCADIAGAGKVLNLCGKLSFSQILALIRQSDWVISSDSGPMHLAAALEIPQLAIFGATHPRLGFAPQNPKARILCADLDCQPCSLHGSKRCPRGHFKCMHSISVQSIQKILSSS